jgi:hypothetical protein
MRPSIPARKRCAFLKSGFSQRFDARQFSFRRVGECWRSGYVPVSAVRAIAEDHGTHRLSHDAASRVRGFELESIRRHHLKHLPQLRMWSAPFREARAQVARPPFGHRFSSIKGCKRFSAILHSLRQHTFSKHEQVIIDRYRTPAQVQQYLRSLPYNWGNTLRTFRSVVHNGSANCIEAALTAAAIMEQHGYPPLLLDLMSQDQLDHVLFLFKVRERWGTIAKSRDIGLHGRKPVFRTIRDLVFSYVDAYVDTTGRVVGYGVADLNELTRANWRLSERSVWTIEKALIDMPHQRLKTSDERYKKNLRKFLAFKKEHPHELFPFEDPRGREL